MGASLLAAAAMRRQAWQFKHYSRNCQQGGQASYPIQTTDGLFDPLGGVFNDAVPGVLEQAASGMLDVSHQG